MGREKCSFLSWAAGWCHSEKGVWEQGLRPQDEAGEIIKSGFEQVEIEVSVTSQERQPVVI